jgi:hypothetical protein
VKTAARQTWRWLTGYTPQRRIALIFYALYILFAPRINALYDRYRGPVGRADEWVLMISLAGGVILFGYAWLGGRGARRRRRDSQSGGAR